MFDDDSAARRALRTLNDEPAPPVSTSLDDVLRKGRRRVFVQRAVSVAGVVAVVAAIGAGAVLLRPGDQPDGVRVAESTTETTATANPPETTPDTPTSTSAPAGPAHVLPGWQQTTMPPDVVESGGYCQLRDTAEPPNPNSVFLAEGRVKPAFVDAVGETLGDVPTVAMSDWQVNSGKTGAPRGYVAVEVPMVGGNGQLQLEVDPYIGTPTEMADLALAAYGNCEPPARRVLDDGTVLQLYAADWFNPEQPHQALQIYQPEGVQLVVTSAGWSEADMVPIGGGGSTIEGGRGALPTTDAELAEIARALVQNMG